MKVFNASVKFASTVFRLHFRNELFRPNEPANLIPVGLMLPPLHRDPTNITLYTFYANRF